MNWFVKENISLYKLNKEFSEYQITVSYKKL